MIIKSETLKKYCNIILQAVDSNELSILTETLQLKTENTMLVMSVTNKEYFAKVKLDLTQSEDFHATVNANLFLKLVSQITTSDIELLVDSNSMIVKGNGTYKLPLIFDNDKLLDLPEIKISNPVNELDINSSILNSILQFNSKELLKGTISRPVQKLYYVDEQGAITFTSGACVNSFTLTKPIKLLLNDRLVKLFKLFQDTEVHTTLGYDALSDTIIQTKVQFATRDIELTAILSCDDTLINSVPVTAIRQRANNLYNYSINLDRNCLLQTINRLLLFNSGNGSKEILKPYSCFEFKDGTVTIWDVNKVNSETLNYNNSSISGDYTATLNLVELKATLETCNESYLTLSFGDHSAFVLTRGNVKNVIPEIRMM